MSALALPLAPALDLDPRRLMRAAARAEPGFFGLGLLLLLLMLPTGLAALIDVRQFDGAPIWLKPLKFELALGTYALTLALFATWLPAGMSARAWYRLYRGSVVAAILFEIVFIAGAAALGTASHFNESAVGEIVYPLMGVLAVLLTSASAVYALAIARNGHTGLAPAVKLSLVLGLALVLPLTLVTAGTMGGNDGHFVGAVAGAEARGLALFGWSREWGDLRVSHFFATHAMHFVPLFGLSSAAVLGGRRLGPVWLFAGAYAGLVLFTFVQALDGRPFLPALG